MKTTPSTIVAAQSLEHLLQESLQNFPRLWMRSRDLLISAAMHSDGSEAAACSRDGDDAQNLMDATEDLLDINRTAFGALPHWSSQPDIVIERTFLCKACRCTP